MPKFKRNNPRNRFADGVGAVEKLIAYSVDKENGCREWVKNKRQGYGRLVVSARSYVAHRLSYETFVGPIPEGKHLDHLCRNRACINPSHLEPVTIRENVLRGIGRTARHAAQTHCSRGHLLAGTNVYQAPGRPRVRHCRACIEIRKRSRGYRCEAVAHV